MTYPFMADNFEAAARAAGDRSGDGDDRLLPAAPPAPGRAAKRGLDLLLALLLVPVVAGVLLALWLLIRRDGGPGFFGHARVGEGGRTFRCWKLRTMVVDADARLAEHLARSPEAAAEWTRDHKLADDPRVTPIGRLLRRTSLDELPQLWNVIRGEMSFVGPRPVTRAELARYGRDAWVFQHRPGITGLWQVSGRNDLSYDERVRLDVAYCRTRTLWGDVVIIARTAAAVLGRTGR